MLNGFTPAKLEALQFDNSFVNNLPGDTDVSNNRRQVYGACYSKVQPTPVSGPELLAYSPEVAGLLDLDDVACNSRLFTEVFAGNTVLPDMSPFAMCYGGHQFGSWAGQLGDGRAINLGEVINTRGDRWVLQLKGAGPTQYSRRADGLAVLRSSVREFLCSEAMHHLGIPTTRALSLVTTGEQVLRDILYDGHPGMEPGAVVCRVSPSFLRFGNFELFASRNDTQTLQALINYTLATDFPHLDASAPDAVLQMFAEICERTAHLIDHWMRVGFVHGVMNTDNMSTSGLTIDYGPYGWLEPYDVTWTPNTTDFQGRRYSYGNQPHIGLWNLTQLANAFHSITGEAARLQEILNNSYRRVFLTSWQNTMAGKLGLRSFNTSTDDDLVNELLDILSSAETDMTIFFRNLAEVSPTDHSGTGLHHLPPELADAYYQPEAINRKYLQRLQNWLNLYRRRLQADNLDERERKSRMNRINPKYVLRNYMAQLAIDKAEDGDPSLIHELHDLLRHPYDEQPEREKYFQKRPEWARHKVGCSMLS
ncbi:protein adenylyltransferase SelO [Desulfosediminicola sp.]|uniref:protein adenylyltransferase SelO n=1 Tax=Desulfosediminicola sp. TaxID=2886825 RepID=UPI003AF1E2DE